MLEIIFLIFIGIRLARVAGAKGRSPLAWVVLAVGAEIVGQGLGYGMFVMAMDLGFVGYLISMTFGLSFAFIVYQYVKSLPPGGSALRASYSR